MIPTKNDFAKERDRIAKEYSKTYNLDYNIYKLGWNAGYNFIRQNSTLKELQLSLIEEWIDAYIRTFKHSPTYAETAKYFKISKQSMYVKLNHYRHKMRKNKITTKLK